MLGPLPPLYRWIVSVLALAACVGVGAWLAWTLPVPVLAPAGAIVGAALGALVVRLLLQDGSSPTSRSRSRGEH